MLVSPSLRWISGNSSEVGDSCMRLRGSDGFERLVRAQNLLRFGRIAGATVIAASLIAACARSAPPSSQSAPRSDRMSGVDPRYGTSPSPRVVNDGSPIPKGGGTYKIGVPYQIAGRWYAPRAEPDYDRAGIASWYGDDFHGRKTANGELYDMRALSAAHPTLPMPSYVWVTNLASRRTLLVRVNDRGPYAHDRLIDLSRASARALGFAGKGLAHVRVRYAGPAPLNGDDRREQAYLRTQPWNDGSPETTAGQSLVKSRSLADAGVWRMGGDVSTGSGAGNRRRRRHRSNRDRCLRTQRFWAARERR